MTKNEKRALYTGSIDGSDAIGKMREDIKRMIGMIVAGMDTRSIDSIDEKMVMIRDEDAEWILQIVGERRILEFWLTLDNPHVMGEKLPICICKVQYEGGYKAKNIEHQDVSHTLIEEIDAAIPTLVHGMMSKYESVSRQLAIKISAAKHYAVTR